MENMAIFTGPGSGNPFGRSKGEAFALLNFSGPATSSAFLFRASMGFTRDMKNRGVSVCPPGLHTLSYPSISIAKVTVILSSTPPLHPCSSISRKASGASPKKFPSSSPENFSSLVCKTFGTCAEETTEWPRGPLAPRP